MKVIVAGDRLIEDYEEVKKAIAASGFKITELISGGAKGCDLLGERWAKENNVKVTQFIPEWDNIDRKGADIKVNSWGKKYDRLAGIIRNERMAMCSDACIAIQKQGEPSPGTQNMIKVAKENNLKVYVHTITKPDSDFDYKF